MKKEQKTAVTSNNLYQHDCQISDDWVKIEMPSEDLDDTQCIYFSCEEGIEKTYDWTNTTIFGYQPDPDQVRETAVEKEQRIITL